MYWRWLADLMNLAAVSSHGGGYQYRLCPADQPLTEDCMQKMPLEFDRAEGTSLVWNNGTRLKIENVFVSEGTWPRGSTWVSPLRPNCCSLQSLLDLMSVLHVSP